MPTWRRVCEAQAAVVDRDSGQPVGPLPRFDALMAFFERAAGRPVGRETLVHGDYKIDNLVFHPTEPRVVGILEWVLLPPSLPKKSVLLTPPRPSWEMSTIGHPLSDLCNMRTDFFTASHPAASRSRAFLPGATPGLPDVARLVGWYAEVAGYDPAADRDLTWGMAFTMFRNAAVCQGIAARLARRQASSEKAKLYADKRAPLAELAWRLAKEAREQHSIEKRAKL